MRCDERASNSIVSVQIRSECTYVPIMWLDFDEACGEEVQSFLLYYYDCIVFKIGI